MKKYLLAGVVVFSASSAALAADLQPAPPEVYDWTGFYLGLNAGVAWNNSSVDDSVKTGDLPGDLARQLEDKIQGDQTAFTGGGEIGYNWQIDSVVVGVETDFNYLGFDQSKNRSRDIEGLGTVNSELTLKADWFGTLRGRLGYAFDNFLIYGTGGLAYGHVDANGKINVDTGEGTDSWKGTTSNTNVGWTIGGGAEYAIDPNWTIGAEYLYVDLGNPDMNFEQTAAETIHEKIDGKVNVAFSVVRATLKYKF
jgi:outer membrane immunogenic protein